jgi:hypothetical protein
MLLSKVKQSIDFKTKTKFKLPDNEVLAEYINEAMLYVATRCDPTELIREPIEGEEIFRMIEGGKVVIKPEYPDFSNPEQHVMIDEVLIYAVINYAVFLLGKEVFYKQLADEDIAIYCSQYGREAFGEILI